MPKLVRSRRSRFAAVLVTGAISVGLAAGPASAQPQQGLVNIDLDVSRNNVAITVPVNAAANICDVNVVVLAQDLQDGSAPCDADADQTVTTGQRTGRPG
ncbi:MAG: hypothetical protein H0U12_02455 [Thermoleophilaceae bacterium]|nr:hypothetical protein [Thermoleophilaceae bacterium]